MTNHWSDIGNTSFVFAIGCNPAENHPACMNHINTARFDTRPTAFSRKAKMFVVDPRKTRTALQADKYIRIRPGTDIAFMNGVLRYILSQVNEAAPVGTFATNFVAWHNGTASNSTSFGRTFADDGGTTRTLNAAELTSVTYNGTPTTAFSATRGWPKYCDSRVKVATGAAPTDYQRATMVTATGYTFSNMLVFANDITDPDCVYQKVKAHIAPYTLATVAGVCGCSQQDIIDLATELMNNSRLASSDFGSAAANVSSSGYKATTLLYAMGATQHTCGSQNIRSYAVVQTMLGNMGRAGGGINALRGIHNVQGSTDMGVLYDLIPAYSGNPGVGQAYSDYSNKLFGNRMVGTGAKDPYTPSQLGLQQRGFYNMTVEWFGKRLASGTYTAADFDKLYALWPKGSGVHHIDAFRKMVAGPGREIKACLVVGQNPAVTEPNQSFVRQGFHDLDLLVVQDMFETETAACDRKADGVTYLLPSCAHVEEAGSVTNSGRWLQWRQRARAPKGNSKADLELLLRLAKALDAAGAFTHITAQWATMTSPVSGTAFDVLYAKYGWNGTGDMEAVTGTSYEGAALAGSDYVAEQLYKEMCRPLDDASVNGGGTIWIYSGMGAASGYNTNKGNVQPVLTPATNWDLANRARNRNNSFRGSVAHYPRWGWAWLLNRRVFYNNSEIADDVADVFVAPGVMARLFVINSNTLADWSLLYRAYNTLADRPDGTYANHVFPGRIPAHTEPYETPYDGSIAGKANLVAAWGRNTAAGASLVPSDTARGTASTYPFILTTIRCVEHFQGGPITRNNPWNVEAEPEPWIEVNSQDAAALGIANGDMVKVTTARGSSTQTALHPNLSDPSGAGVSDATGLGFRARVGVGLQSNQRVGTGVVAIPWHWGDKGLSTGSRANDLTIDAYDANTKIPEYKVCLCKIEKM